MVADAILTGNQQGGNTQINLVSLAIGNGVGGPDDDDEEERRELDFWYGHGGVGYTTMKGFWQQCGAYGNLSRACETLLDKAEQNIGPFYIYNMYRIQLMHLRHAPLPTPPPPPAVLTALVHVCLCVCLPAMTRARTTWRRSAWAT